MKNVTIQDIADKAQVSKSTVSRVLNGTTAVHPDKRDAVLRATELLGFRPNFFARSLASGRSMTIGVLTQIIGSPFYDTIARGVIAGMGGSGYSPIFMDGQWQRKVEAEAIRALLGRHVDGLILIGGDVPPAELVELCSDVPTVVVARQLPDGDHNCIYCDNVDGGYQATKHLIELGHRAIVKIGGIAHHPDAVDRLAGYEKALTEAGIDIDPELIVAGDFTAPSGAAAMDALIASGKRFTAAFAANDMTAFGARLAMHRHGLSVPEDVSLVGYDDQGESAFMTPPLTTVRQPAHEMGVQASRGILSMINGEGFEPEPLRAELRVRESAAAPARSE